MVMTYMQTTTVKRYEFMQHFAFSSADSRCQMFTCSCSLLCSRLSFHTLNVIMCISAVVGLEFLSHKIIM